jgi:hypothetical protein
MVTFFKKSLSVISKNHLLINGKNPYLAVITRITLKFDSNQLWIKSHFHKNQKWKIRIIQWFFIQNQESRIKTFKFFVFESNFESRIKNQKSESMVSLVYFNSNVWLFSVWQKKLWDPFLNSAFFRKQKKKMILF